MYPVPLLPNLFPIKLSPGWLLPVSVPDPVEHRRTPRILILLKKNYVYGSHTTKVGLQNSVELLAAGLREIGMEVITAICEDGNSIDREVHRNKPNICILEALWYTPEKLLELQKLHPRVLFISRINSKIPFLAMEGMSIGWLAAYLKGNFAVKQPNVIIGVNNAQCSDDLESVNIFNHYLPNIYPGLTPRTVGNGEKLLQEISFTLDISHEHCSDTIHIGCFGAVRPLKNQLIQAVAAIRWADEQGLKLVFHMNTERLEQKGEEPLKNIRALFAANPSHILLEHGWLDHIEFLQLVGTMNINLQVSYTESFNIVTADSVSQSVPVIVSHDIDWMPDMCKADPNDSRDIARKMDIVYRHKSYAMRKTIGALNTYNQEALVVWKNFFRTGFVRSFL